ncbi:MAG TPA: quinohemoprotein amine dehydrogenase maturase, partial [Deltaproteobacteria bacterium]|nr:quinohemoprotein amine dehydrogenase maturase [Deltaproteobacteria bacterium]
YPCGAGLQMVAGAPNGEMSLCHRFVGEPDYVLGNVKEGGIDSHRRLQILEDIQLSERSDCSSCWARYICSGGCHHVNFLFEGAPSRTYLTHCDYLRAWYRMGLEAYAEIMSRNPEFVGEFIDPGFLCNQ